jgi:hypothetical protein
MAKIMKVADYRAMIDTFEFKPDSFYMRPTAQDTKDAFIKEVNRLEVLLAVENPSNRTKSSIRELRKWLNKIVEIDPPVRKPRAEKPEEDLSPYTHTLEFLGRRYDENAPTKLSPTKPWSDEFLPLLDETVMCCVAFDNDMLVECNLYSKLSFTVPKWMDHSMFGEITWNYFLAAGGSVKWSKAHYDRIHTIDSFDLRYAIIKLINSNPRTDKRKAMKDRFLSWLDGADSIQRWDFVNICDEYTMRDAKNAATREYWNR